MTFIARYNSALRALKSARPELTHRQAQQAWRGVKDRLGHAPLVREIKQHSRIVREEAKRAPAILAGKKGARARRLKLADERIEKRQRARVTRQEQEVSGGSGSAMAGSGALPTPAQAQYEEEHPDYYDDTNYDWWEDPIEPTGKAKR